MNETMTQVNDFMNEYEYSNDKTIQKAIESIKNGRTEEEVQKEFNLTNDDMDLIDFVVNEF
ncbi:hypothetical protein [Siminovitchia acidinfaciens]|uniref:hypothetical protein n=1 Tax=Siminovitchia acidinfaciens TaxID=2321395 RepID=UPI0013DF74E1|nr:hypothetical protein [Siminovitchia acidinfaciens]